MSKNEFFYIFVVDLSFVWIDGIKWNKVLANEIILFQFLKKK